MDVAQAATIIAALAGLAGVLAYFKWKPGQREAFGQSTFLLVTSELEDQFVRMRDDQARDRREHLAYREETNQRLDDLARELRAEKAEKEDVKRENAFLLARVKQLETEVADLKARRAHTTDDGTTP